MSPERAPVATATAAAAPVRRLRRDAQRNRDSLLAAARAVFAEHGMQASLEQVAKRAGVAIGTLYNHFPARLDLVQEVFAGKLAIWVAAAEQALSMDDAWEGLCLFLETMCELQARDRGFNDFASIRLPENACLAGQQTRIHDLGVRIVERAREQGRLRPDLVPEDLAFVIWSHSRIIEATDGIAPHAWRRHLYLMLDGFRAERAHPLPEPPLTPTQLYRAMLRLGGTD
ncbi:helix-turn-helix domain-containing protein [Micromonospora matsumotoense]|uniref:TetR/AcrR family transcriptional regulator n=1 Tax=Micromonospora matsumotoense TaxID=121616 RepID=UPI003425391D